MKPNAPSLFVLDPQRPSWHRPRRSLKAVAVLFLCAAPLSGFAADKVWTGGNNTTRWDIGTNWATSPSPVNNTTTDVAVFSGALTTYQPNVNVAARSISGLRFESAGWKLSGSGKNTADDTFGALLTIGANGVDASAVTAGTVTLHVNISLINSSQTWLVGTGGTLEVEGAMSQTGSNQPDWIIGSATARGTLILSGASTAHGRTVINGGTVKLVGAGSLGSGSLTVFGNGVLDVNTITASTYTIGGTLGGRGLIEAGSKTITLQEALQPGSTGTAGLLTVNGTGLTLQKGANLDLYGTTRGGATNGYDALSLTGELVYGGQLSLAFDETLMGPFQLFEFGSASGALEDVLITGAWGDFSLEGVNGVWSYQWEDTLFTFSEATGVFNVATIPEPSVVLLGLIGVAFLAGRKVSRR